MSNSSFEEIGSNAIPIEIRRAYDNADLLISRHDITQAVDRMAIQLVSRLSKSNPLMICVLQGGIFFFSRLIEKLRFPMELSYVHVSRYGKDIEGGELEWLAKPTICLKGRHVVFVDDVFDHGITINRLVDWAYSEGASGVTTSVLVEKAIAQENDAKADFSGFNVGDRYLFGCGMDYRGYWRNLPDIYALPEDWIE